jgi:hypothetical protein
MTKSYLVFLLGPDKGGVCGSEDIEESKTTDFDSTVKNGVTD